MSSRVPFNDLSRSSPEELDALAAATERVVRSGWYLLGPETDAFESAFADYCGASSCVGVGNGTDALEVAFRSVGVGAGDEVIMAANAGGYSTVAALAIGAVPVFADVDERRLLLDPEAVRGVLCERTRAVVATHLYGAVVEVDRLRSVLGAGVPVIEDCAQAHGATLADTRVGALGDVAAFSFYPTKNLGALGDAGAVITSDPEVSERARQLRQYGWERRYVMATPGGRNTRIDETQAAVLMERLTLLDQRNARRRAVRERYVDALADRLAFVGQDTPTTHGVAHLCVVRVEDRDDLATRLAEHGVATAVHYPIADHTQPVLHAASHRGGSHRAGALPVTERATAEVLSLPCFPELRDDEVERVIAGVRACT